MKVIHAGTKVVTTLAVIDDNGNVVQNFTLQDDKEKGGPLNIKVLDAANFINAFNSVVSAKDQLQAKLDEQLAAKAAKNEKVEDKAKEEAEQSKSSKKAK